MSCDKSCAVIEKKVTCEVYCFTGLAAVSLCAPLLPPLLSFSANSLAASETPCWSTRAIQSRKTWIPPLRTSVSFPPSPEVLESHHQCVPRTGASITSPALENLAPIVQSRGARHRRCGNPRLRTARFGASVMCTRLSARNAFDGEKLS